MLSTPEYMQAFACPACQSPKLLLTKEKIIVCEECLNGYRLLGDIPDFRLDRAISFKRKINQGTRGLSPVLTVLMGEMKNQSLDVKLGHCVVLGRRVQDADNDFTFVGKPNLQTYSHLDPHNHKLIEKFLTKKNQNTANQESILGSQKRFLGSFAREPDFLIADPSVSRSHAIVYQDNDGVHILDLMSKNGTYVNGYEVEFTKLNNNDVVSLGTASLRVNFY